MFLMIRAARVVLILVVVFSIAYVLITPDPTDDVNGILRPNHPVKARRPVVVSLTQSLVPLIAVSRVFASPICTRGLATLELLDLACVSRC